MDNKTFSVPYADYNTLQVGYAATKTDSVVSCSRLFRFSFYTFLDPHVLPAQNSKGINKDELHLLTNDQHSCFSIIKLPEFLGNDHNYIVILGFPLPL